LLIIGHRGASGTAPENTLAAFSEAITQGAGMVELDVQLTLDDKLVVIHDETLNRTTGSMGKVKDYTLLDLQSLDAGKWFAPHFTGERIPTLEEVLKVIPEEIRINIELKNNLVNYPGLETKVITIIAELNLAERVIISTFNYESLALVKNLAPHLATGLLYQQPLKDPLKLAEKLKVQALHPHYSLVTPQLVERAHQKGYPVYTWTVNSLSEMEKLFHMGVDGIMTNYPGELFRLLKNFV